MGETQGMIHLKAKFFSICGPVTPWNKFSDSKLQLWDRHRIGIPIPKGKVGMEKGIIGPGQVQNPTGQIH